MGRARQARQTRRNGSEPVVETPQALEPARIWRIWAGQQCTSSHQGGAVTPKPESVAGGEATRKACGVLVARLQGHSRAPILPTESLVNVGTASWSPCRLSQPGRAGHLAKGPSEVSRSGTGMSGGDGEYRRTDLGRGVVVGRAAGTEDPDQTAPVGQRRAESCVC